MEEMKKCFDERMNGIVGDIVTKYHGMIEKLEYQWEQGIDICDTVVQINKYLDGLSREKELLK